MRTPGHYISLQRNATQADFVRPLSMPGVVGVQRRYVWRDLQPGYRRYSLDQIVSDVELAESMGGKLVVFIEDKTFTDERVLPDYLSQHEYRNRQGGFTAARWQHDVHIALRDLCEAIYTEMKAGSYFGFGGIALQESAPGLDDETLDASGYNPDSYITVLTAARCDYLFLNYIPRAQDRLGEVIAGTKAMVGGPDLLPDSKALQKHVHPAFRGTPNFKHLFGAVQFDDYESGWQLDDLIMWATERYPDTQTELRIQTKGGKGLRVETIFWNDKTWLTPKGSHTVEDAYAAIARRSVL